MNTRRIVLLLFCLLLAGAVAQLLAPEHRLVAEDRPGFQGEDSPLFLPLVVNQSEVPAVVAAGTPAKAAQLFYASRLERAFQSIGDEAPGRRFLPERRIEREQLPMLPPDVRTAFQFYYRTVEVADWGNVYLAAADVGGKSTYAVLVTTDGDGGFLEVYAADGALLGAAQTTLGNVRWMTQEAVRRQAAGE